MFGFGLTVAFIGIGIVFSILIFLILIVTCISFFVRLLDGEKIVPASGKNEPVLPPVQKEQLIQNQTSSEDDDELIAVIAAAVASLSHSSGVPMKIRTISRLNGSTGPAWSYAGRTNLMQLRQF